ncbi:MAG: enoyl-CoA hydratase/isomerase family protein [Pseudonocardia sp.]|uniref:enoyl-CoA hydratase-related protein n=1 Tax=Pseudonocardia sp. TaxID=60912 RepID=UPI001AC2CDD6|nr:enoyl-CoA hydratase-related protein [Pseudonocardia sp.]MBN9099861.1 enoyl-CoA hydratase/isomerase family protein [Pseudonocardia sp.]
MTAVLMDVADGVALITLNRPERLNAYDDELGEGLFGFLGEAADRSDVRAIVLTGAGRGFCAGADFTVLGDLGDGSRAFAEPFSPFSTPRTIAKPVIAAVNGACVGIGLLVALMCDLRFTTPEAKIGTGFATRGLVAEQGLAWLLSRSVGPTRAADLLFSGRLVTGADAAAYGLVTDVHPADELLERTLDYARGLATWSSPASMAAMKWQLLRAEDSDLQGAIDDADELTRRSLTGRDFVEVGARLGRGERPDFPPLPPTRLGAAPPVELLVPPDREDAPSMRTQA